MRYRVTNTTRNSRLAEDAGAADTFWARFKGLMGQTSLPLGHGLLIEPCNSVHTFFMKIDIDVVFLDSKRKVVGVAHSMVPWRMSRYYPSAKSVLELPAGVALASGTQPGDELRFEPIANALTGAENVG